MSAVHAALPATEPSARDDDAALRRACSQLEGVFLQQLMKALRETIPHSGLADGGTGEEIFTTLLDEHLSSSAAARLDRGLGAALYRQLRGATPVADGTGSEER